MIYGPSVNIMIKKLYDLPFSTTIEYFQIVTFAYSLNIQSKYKYWSKYMINI